jgi:hypothetical protein
MLDPDLRRLTPGFEVQLDDLSHWHDDEIRGRAMGPAATLSWLFLRDGRREGRIIGKLVSWADLFRALDSVQNGRRALLQLFSYLSMVAPSITPGEFIEQVQRAIPERNDIVSTLAEQWMEQGEQRGINKGRVEGRLVGRRETVRRLIELKFGSLGSEAVTQIESADESALDRYTERVLTATAIEEVLGTLAGAGAFP